MISVVCDRCKEACSQFATLLYNINKKKGEFHICNDCLPIVVKAAGITGKDGKPRGKPQSTRTPACPCKKIGELWNEEAERLEKHEGIAVPRVLYPLADGLCNALKKVWRSSKSRQSLDYWRETFAYVFSCPALVAQGTGWVPTFGWVIGPQNLSKIETRPYPVRTDEDKEFVL